MRANVGDFSVSRVVAGEQSATMTHVGTFPWTSPEVIHEQRYTESADVYSFGVVLWELITRKVPFYGMTALQVILHVVASDSCPLPVDDDVLSSPLGHIMLRCLNFKQGQRPTMADIHTELLQLKQQQQSNNQGAAILNMDYVQ
eukprot:TRINITY_DN14596_c0_g1_i1.p1 TRINITY_DN14596_c0_g1~~TRINITY_DN14596_c0_g1_i1.p1  ORF type:complete len:144 (+),score=12.87 TRINITY_DN14596_c0_g1_i1:328-759(+)